MAVISFGQVIPVTGPNLGFPGTISRQGERVAASRQFVPTTNTNLNFGDPAVVVENAQGGYYDSVADFIAAATANVGLVASQFAGVAVREVQTQLAYPVGFNVAPGAQQVGYYAASQMATVLERGSTTVNVAVANSPVSGSQVYTRAVNNTAVSAGTVGDWEIGAPAASDLFMLNGITAAAAAATSLTGITFTGVYVGQVVSGPGIAPGTYVVSGTGTVGSYTTIVLSNGLTTAITATSVLTFSNLIALPNTVARTGFLDANSVMEITLKIRNAA